MKLYFVITLILYKSSWGLPQQPEQVTSSYPPMTEAGPLQPTPTEQPKDLHGLMDNLMLFGGASATAPLVHGLVRGLEVMIDEGKRSLKALAGMMIILDEAPPLQTITNKIIHDIQIIEHQLVELTQSVENGASTVKTIVKCVSQNEEVIQNLKVQVIRDVKSIVNQQKGVIKDLLAAGDIIRTDLKNLQIIERKVLSAGTPDEALQESAKTKQATDGEARNIERIFLGAVEKFQQSVQQSIDGLSLALQNVEVNGKRVLRDIKKCVTDQENLSNEDLQSPVNQVI